MEEGNGESVMKASKATRRFLRSQRHIVSDATLETYTHLLKRFVDFFEGRKIHTIETTDLREYRLYLFEQKTKAGKSYAPASINAYLRTAKRLFSWLESEGYIEGNPARRLEFVKEPEPEPTAVDFNVLVMMLNATAGSLKLRDEAILLFLFGTGCRVGELCGLRLDDIDWSRPAVHVTGKGNKSRWVALDDIVAEALDKYIHYGRPMVEGDHVFQGQRGPLTTRGVWQRLRDIGAAAGVNFKKEHINPHSFRHAFVVHMLLRNVPDATVAKIVGHSDPKITGTIYAKFKPDQISQAHRSHSPSNLLRPNGRRRKSELDDQLSHELPRWDEFS